MASLEYARSVRPGVLYPAGGGRVDGFVVTRHEPEAAPEIVAWYPDEYSAKHEAQRWEQDSKVPHSYTPATLDVP